MNNPMQILSSMIKGGNPMQMMNMLGNNPMQIMNMFKSGNPSQMINMFGGNPMFQQAQKMLEGKNPQQIQQTVFNVAKQKGISEEQIKQFANQLGIKL